MARVTSDFSQEDWLRGPRGKWNSAEILEHLLLSYAETTRGCLKAMEVGRPLGGTPTFRQHLATLLVAGLGFMPSGRRSPKQTIPRGTIPPGSLRKFNDSLVAMDASLVDAEKRFGSKAKLLDHHILGPLSAQQWRRFHRTHAMHHIRQIKRRSRGRE